MKSVLGIAMYSIFIFYFNKFRTAYIQINGHVIKKVVHSVSLSGPSKYLWRAIRVQANFRLSKFPDNWHNTTR